MSWSVVVPTVRPERYAEFLEEWTPLFAEHDVQLVAIFDGPRAEMPEGTHYAWEDIPGFIPTRTDMIRSWGIYQAWRLETTYTLSLDDDVRPVVDVFRAYEDVFERGAPVSEYLDVGALTTSGLQMRGFPYGDRVRREVAVQYGGWHGVLDFDAATQLATPRDDDRFSDVVLPVPRGAAVTGCAMNMAWKRDYAPLVWQLPLYEGRYLRYGDIWSGLFVKRTCDATDRAVVVNGKASVLHERASDPFQNLDREYPGVRFSEGLWDALDLPSGDPLDAFEQVTDSAYRYFLQGDTKYARAFLSARDRWLALFL